MPINFVKSGNDILIICNNCGIINLPDVAKKNKTPTIITSNIRFLYKDDFFESALSLFFSQKMDKTEIINIKTINNFPIN